MLKKYRIIYKFILVIFVFFQFQFYPYIFTKPISIPGTDITVNPGKLSLLKPDFVDMAGGISSSSATLSNSRLSYYTKSAGTVSAGRTLITVGTANNADNNTNNIFPGDSVIAGTTDVGTVASVPDSTHFYLTTGLPVGIGDSTNVYVAQTGTITLSFYTASAIPVGGNVTVIIPGASANQNDGRPDTATSTATNGFDMNTIDNTNITCPGGFTAASPTINGSGDDTTIVCSWGHGTNSLPGGANLSIVIGNTTKGIVNPAPVGVAHTSGAADVYTVTVRTYNTAGGTIIDDGDLKVGAVDGVLVSALVDESLTFTVTSIASGSVVCNGTTTVASTPYSIPFSTVLTSTTYNAAQRLSVNTNASAGFNVKIEENDQMGKEGVTCASTAPSAGDYTFGAQTCIRDSVCGATPCSESSAQDWTSYTTYPGLGFSLANVSGGTYATFAFADSGRTFSARQIADIQGSETRQNIMLSTVPTASAVVDVCYRLAVASLQPAGYYYNKVRYTAAPTF